MRVQLIIKGNCIDSFTAANKHGIDLISAKASEKWNEMICEADSDPMALNQWFIESDLPGSEFPVGTLMHWAPIDVREF